MRQGDKSSRYLQGVTVLAVLVCNQVPSWVQHLRQLLGMLLSFDCNNQLGRKSCDLCGSWFSQVFILLGDFEEHTGKDEGLGHIMNAPDSKLIDRKTGSGL